MGSRQAERLRPRWLPAAVVAMALLGCGKATESVTDQTKRPSVQPQGSVAASSPRPEASTRTQDPDQRTEVALAWYVAMRDDPDPSIRLRLVEAWAQQALPEDRMNLLTHALVDPDESVRARAQELLEQELARR